MDPLNQGKETDLSSSKFEFVNSAPIQNVKKSRSPRFKENLSTIIILISAPLLAILLSIFVFRTYQVDGPSMATTLQDKDRLIINKLPKTFSSITGKDYIPSRYDIVVFNHKGSFSGGISSEKQIIKRVIALPGERIVVKGGIVKVHNKDNPDGFLVDKLGPHTSVINVTEGNIDETVKDGQVFVMGDNRGNSLDSRALGTIDSDDIVGKLVLRVFPFKDWRGF